MHISEKGWHVYRYDTSIIFPPELTRKEKTLPAHGDRYEFRQYVPGIIALFDRETSRVVPGLNVYSKRG